MSTIFFDETTLGNVLAFYADCRRLEGIARLTFINDMAPLFHEYSRANAADYLKSYQDRHGRPEPVSAKAIRTEALKPCHRKAAHRDIVLLRYNALEPTPAVARMITELYHHLFWQRWQSVETNSPLAEIHPGEITPCLYTAADLALLASWPVFVNTDWGNTDPVVKRYSGYLETFAGGNAALFCTEPIGASTIASLIRRPEDRDLVRYFYLTCHLFPSMPADASLDAWDTALCLYEAATTYNKYRYPLYTRRYP